MYIMILYILIIIPIIGIIHIFCINNINSIKQVSLIYSIITYIYSIYILYILDSNSIYYSYSSNILYIPIGIDGISIYFVIITTTLIPICILSNWYNIYQSYSIYYINILILEFIIICIFIVTDIFYYYIFFEAIIIPFYIIIGYTGSGSIRSKAAFYFLLYTLFGSMIMLISIIYIYIIIGSSNFSIINMYILPNNISIYIFIGIFIGVWVKTPLYPFHIWLPLAHASSSLGGSILLAGIVLKLASYTSIRILVYNFQYSISISIPIIVSICIITIIYSNLVTIRMTDTKTIIAYSSIGHMGIIILAIFSNSIDGIYGSYIYNIGHAYVSPMLFILLGGIIYDRLHTRIIYYINGICSIMPIFSIFYLICTFSNISTPYSSNWIGEILCIIGIGNISITSVIFCSITVILSVCYSIWMYNRIVYSNSNNYIYMNMYNNMYNIYMDITYREFCIVFIILIHILLFGIFSNTYCNIIIKSIINIIYI